MKNNFSTHLIINYLKELIKDEPNWIANLSNASAILNDSFNDINWVGFYLWNEEDQQLVLGPFQGRVACIRIDPGKGVCGTAFAEQKTIIVPDVNKFPGHIVCDSRSQSEIVIPLIKKNKTIGVLDLDAPIIDRFGEKEKDLLENFVQILLEYT